MANNSKAFPAFGWAVIKNSFDAGDIFSDELFSENVYTIYNPSPYRDGRYGNTLSGYQWLYTEGQGRTTNMETGEYVDRLPGYCNLVTWEQIGTFRVDFLAPTTVFCINVVNNPAKGAVPDTTYFGLKAGEKQIISNGTKLYLASGGLLINGTNTTGPRQLHFSNGDREVEALQDSYGYLFP